MPYWQHRFRFKNNHWEQEKFNDCYSKEYKCIAYATSCQTVTHPRQQNKHMGPGGWTNEVMELHGYNRAGHVGDGNKHTQMPPGGGHRHGYGLKERKEVQRAFLAAKKGGNGVMMSEHRQKRRLMGYSTNHGYSSHSDSESCSDSENQSEEDSENDFEEKLTIHNMAPKLKSSKRSYHMKYE